jgi:hypothetical protein
MPASGQNFLDSFAERLTRLIVGWARDFFGGEGNKIVFASFTRADVAAGGYFCCSRC